MGIYIYNTDQIKRIEDACSIASAVLDRIDEIIEPGISTFELDVLAQGIIKKNKAKSAFLGYRGFPASICTSINNVVVHGIPNKNDILKNGDIIGIDVGVCLQGYYGDTARSYSIGTISYEAEKLLQVTKDSLYSGIQQCTVGKRISDISNAIENTVMKYGFLPVHEFVGHGIGLNLHEEPSVPNYGKPGKGPRIKNGMVFAIEPMINQGTYQVEVDKADKWTVYTKDRKLSAHFEHTVAVVQDTAKILSKGKFFN